MPEVEFCIEERLSKTVKLDVPQSIIDEDDVGAMLQIVSDAYRRGDIVLDSDDYYLTEVAITDERFPTEFTEL